MVWPYCLEAPILTHGSAPCKPEHIPRRLTNKCRATGEVDEHLSSKLSCMSYGQTGLILLTYELWSKLTIQSLMARLLGSHTTSLLISF